MRKTKKRKKTENKRNKKAGAEEKEWKRERGRGRKKRRIHKKGIREDNTAERPNEHKKQFNVKPKQHFS